MGMSMLLAFFAMGVLATAHGKSRKARRGMRISPATPGRSSPMGRRCLPVAADLCRPD